MFKIKLLEMKYLIFIISFLLCSFISNAQYKLISVDSSSKRFTYAIEQVGFGSNTLTFSTVYKSNSLYFGNKIKRINECGLEGGLLRIKKEVVEILKNHVAHLAAKALKDTFQLSVKLLPRYDGNIAEVWFNWSGIHRFFTEDEMDALINDLQKIRVVFKESGCYDTPYCQWLTFGILPKDWEYILNSTKGK